MTNVKIPNQKEIDDFLNRGIENIYPSKGFLEARLKEGKQLKIYLGIDPTGPCLHIGHAINLMLLKRFQDLGHKIILLVGDFTAMIGDPTDKSATRVPLTHEQVLSNCKNYKDQASKIIKFDGDNPCEFMFNSTWLSKLDFEGVLNLSSHFTVQQMLERDMFDKRMKEGKPINLTEFMYPLMQGYDCVAMDVEGEIGGNDQTFNMLAGRTMMKAMKNKEKFVVTNKLLVDPTGKKMGKSEGNMITLIDEPNDMFGKVMSWTDGMILNGFELCTTVPMSEILEMKEFMEKGGNPKDLKVRLASEIVRMYYGDEKAKEALSYFESTFAKKELDPDSFPKVSIQEGEDILDVLSTKCDVESRGEAKRLITQNAVKLDGEIISKIDYKFDKGSSGKVLQVGKKKFFKIEL